MDDLKNCETCAHSSRYAVTGDLLCLGPVDVIFCKNVEQPCECWEAEEEEEEKEEENDGEDDI